MHGLAKKIIIATILNRLNGQLVDEAPKEYKTLNSQKTNDGDSFAVTWRNGNGDTAFTLVIIEENLKEIVQKAILANDENLVGSYMEKIDDFIVFRAVAQDNGDSYVWIITTETLTADYF